MARLPPLIEITNRVQIASSEISLSYARSGGPGGQHVNKTSSKVVLRWNAMSSEALSEHDKRWLWKRLASKLTESGELIVTSEKGRDQSRNVDDAVRKFAQMIREAIKRPTPRRKTRPTRGSKERRLQSKRQRSSTKKMRKRPSGDD